MSEITLNKTLLEIPRELITLTIIKETKDEEAVEKPTSGDETVKDEETFEKPKNEPTSNTSHLGRRITSDFKKKPEKAQGYSEEQKKGETQKVGITDSEDKKKKKKRASMQKKRQVSQSEKKQDSKAVQDEFEIIKNEVKKEYPDATKQGKLHKESQILKRNEERYFAFHNGILYYFKNSQTKKQINIDKSCQVNKFCDKRFEIETSIRTFKFQASTEEDQVEWTKVIQDYIDNLPGLG
ncbi:PH domain-like protein [Gigaspora margarita]|uniref:PH domain-like protein n=1 Tax=Gigaspora margarita TaxID=4874 RepID=A0A8H3X7R2_GIGMA|nr:PH domain-like protein [Gigaspora margarita]